MPANSQRVFASYAIRLAKTVQAPAKYVFDWATDLQSADGQYYQSKPRFQVLQLEKDRVVRIRVSKQRGQRPKIALELIRLRPPNAWHVDQIDETDLETTDYRVTPLGRKRSRITLLIRERWMTPKYPSRGAYQTSSSRFWDGLIAALEKRYQAGHPAKG